MTATTMTVVWLLTYLQCYSLLLLYFGQINDDEDDDDDDDDDDLNI